MADRGSVYADERVLALAERFVCAADEVWRLQRGSDFDCVFFQHAVNEGERVTGGGTRQGTWIFAPSGRLLGMRNTRDADLMVGLLERCLAEWEALGEEERRLPPDADLTPRHRWEQSYPEDGLVLERIARDLGRDLTAQEDGRWNRDYAWFTREELTAFAWSDAAPGDELDLSPLARRLARFHLVDNARGQTLPFADPEVERAELRGRVTARESSRITLALEGATAGHAEGPWRLGENLWKPSSGEASARGIECTLAGRAVWNGDEERFERFDLIAVGRRWGRTRMNGRGHDSAPGYLGFAMGIAPDVRRTRVAPTFIAVYDADWVVHPDVPTWRTSPGEIGLTR